MIDILILINIIYLTFMMSYQTQSLLLDELPLSNEAISQLRWIRNNQAQSTSIMEAAHM